MFSADIFGSVKLVCCERNKCTVNHTKHLNGHTLLELTFPAELFPFIKSSKVKKTLARSYS